MCVYETIMIRAGSVFTTDMEKKSEVDADYSPFMMDSVSILVNHVQVGTYRSGTVLLVVWCPASF